MGHLLHKDDFAKIRASVRSHCLHIGLSEVRIVACEAKAVALLTAGRSPAKSIAEAKQQAERYSTRREPLRRGHPSAQPSNPA